MTEIKHKVGIIGAGVIADFHAQALLAMQGVELVAAYARNQEKADSFSPREPSAERVMGMHQGRGIGAGAWSAEARTTSPILPPAVEGKGFRASMSAHTDLLDGFCVSLAPRP